MVSSSGLKIMRKSVVILLLCILFTGLSGCTSPPEEKKALQQPVFSNGSVVTDGPWISMDPPRDHRRDETITISGTAGLPVKSIVQVIIVRSGPSAAKIRSVDDCITEKQKCVLYFAKVTGNTTGTNRWSITTDESMDLFPAGSQDRFTVIAEDETGDLSVQSEFSLT
jgi:hypothetical protein